MTMAFAFNRSDWLNVLSIAFNIYYFTFLLNSFTMFIKKQNVITKIFYGHLKTPMYLATLTLITVRLFEKSSGANFDIAYLSILIGFIVGIISMIKLGMEKKPS